MKKQLISTAMFLALPFLAVTSIAQTSPTRTLSAKDILKSISKGYQSNNAALARPTGDTSIVPFAHAYRYFDDGTNQFELSDSTTYTWQPGAGKGVELFPTYNELFYFVESGDPIIENAFESTPALWAYMGFPIPSPVAIPMMQQLDNYIDGIREDTAVITVSNGKVHTMLQTGVLLYTNEYDANGNLVKQINSTTIGDPITDSMTYDINNRRTGIYRTNQLGDQTTVFETNYNSAGQINTTQLVDSYMGAIQFGIIDTVFSVNANKDSVACYYYDNNASAYVPMQTMIFFKSANDIDSVQMLDEMNNYLMTIITHRNAAGNLSLIEAKESGSIIGRVIYSYTGDGLISETYFEDIFNSQTETFDKKVYAYDTLQNLIEFTTYATLDIGSNTWIQDSDDVNYKFYYKPYLDDVSAKNLIAAKDFEVYPNPSKNTLTLKMADAAIATIQVLDINGKVLLYFQAATNATQAQIDISTLASGTYLLQVNTQKGSGVQKIVKQ